MKATNSNLGHVRSSLDYVKEQFTTKKTNQDVKIGIKSMCDNLNYYLNLGLDTSELMELVKFHDAKERQLKTSQNFDKSLNRQGTGKLIVLGRIGDILK